MDEENETKNEEDSVVRKRTRISQIYNTKRFEEGDISKLKKTCKSFYTKSAANVRNPMFYVNYLLSRVPIFDWLPKYKIAYLLPDIIAGVTVGIMCIPQVFFFFSFFLVVVVVTGLQLKFLQN